MKKNADLQKKASVLTVTDNYNRNESFKAQRQRLLKALESGPISTIQARDELNIMAPAARVKELRESGHIIITEMIWIDDAHGRGHKSGCYYLINEGGDE